MKASKRWLSAALACALTASVSISAVLALPAPEPLADFRIDASDIDVSDFVLTLEVYQPNEAGIFQTADTAEYSCKLNRVTEDAGFYIQPKTDGILVTVDYLADLNGDGVYDLLDGDNSPIRDSMDSQGKLSQDEAYPLIVGQTYILSAELLSDRYNQAIQAGAQALGQETNPQKFPLCQVTLHRVDPTDGQDYEQLYYLELYGKILVPIDLSPNQWYYNAVEYGLTQGYFTGMEDGRFGPDEPLTRAQLAQVLWAADGSLDAEGAVFSDVASNDWFYPAVSWCQQEGLIAGYDGDVFAPYSLLTREQLASILHRYARYTGSNLSANVDLSVYTDYEDISPWAYNSMRWAMTNRLLIDSDNALRPGDTVSRAELAAALYAYDINLGLRSTR